MSESKQELSSLSAVYVISLKYMFLLKFHFSISKGYGVTQ